MRLLRAWRRGADAAPVSVRPLPALQHSPRPPANRAQSLIRRLEKLQRIKAIDTIASHEILAAHDLLGEILAECPSFYVEDAARRLRAARQVIAGLDTDTEHDSALEYDVALGP